MRRAIIEMAAFTLLLACATRPHLTSAAFLLPSPHRTGQYVTISRKQPRARSTAESIAALTRGGAILIDRRRQLQHQHLQSTVAMPVPTRTPPAPQAIQRGGAQRKEIAKETEGGHGASMAASIFNLVNNVAGAGILTLAAGKASGTGWIPAVAIVCFLGWASSTTFRLIARACELTEANDFKVCFFIM